MKILLYLVLILTFFSCTRNSETKTAQSSENEIVIETNQETAELETKELRTVEDIREEYQSIVSKIANGKIDSTFFEYQCEVEGGKVVYFSENEELRKIQYSSGYEHGGSTKEFFLKDNAVFFIFHDISTWSFDIDAKQEEDNLESATRDDMTEKRFYIIDNKLIKCLEKEYTIRSSVKNNPTSETVANKEMECSDLTSLLEDYNLVLKYKNQTKKMECLEE